MKAYAFQDNAPRSHVAMDESMRSQESQSTGHIPTHGRHLVRQQLEHTLGRGLGGSKVVLERAVGHELKDDSEGLLASAHTEQAHNLHARRGR